MNMKKMLSLALAGVMALSLMACSAQNGGDSSENTSSPSSSQSGGETQNGGAPESVTITSLNANKEARSWRCLTILSASPFWTWLPSTFWTPWVSVIG